jgi:hypothetical protein
LSILPCFSTYPPLSFTSTSLSPSFFFPLHHPPLEHSDSVTLCGNVFWGDGEREKENNQQRFTRSIRLINFHSLHSHGVLSQQKHLSLSRYKHPTRIVSSTTRTGVEELCTYRSLSFAHHFCRSNSPPLSTPKIVCITASREGDTTRFSKAEYTYWESGKKRMRQSETSY